MMRILFALAALCALPVFAQAPSFPIFAPVGGSGTGLTDGDKGDVVVSSSGSVLTVDPLPQSRITNLTTDLAARVQAANNGSDFTNIALVRQNLGLIIGTHVQAYSTHLFALAGLTHANGMIPMSNGTGFVGPMLVNCSNPATDKMLFNLSTRTFGCGSDQNSGGLGSLTGIIKATSGTPSVALAEADYVTPTGSGTLTSKTLDGPILSSTTVASLPSAAANTAKLYIVTDGATPGSCSAGGGTSISICRSNGSAWISVGDGNNGTGSTYTAGAGIQIVGSAIQVNTAVTQTRANALEGKDNLCAPTNTSATAPVCALPFTLQSSMLTTSGTQVEFRPDTSSGASPTLNVDGTGAFLVKEDDGTTAATYIAGKTYAIIWQTSDAGVCSPSTNCLWRKKAGSSSAAAPDVSLVVGPTSGTTPTTGTISIPADAKWAHIQWCGGGGGGAGSSTTASGGGGGGAGCNDEAVSTTGLTSISYSVGWAGAPGAAGLGAGGAGGATTVTLNYASGITTEMSAGPGLGAPSSDGGAAGIGIYGSSGANGAGAGGAGTNAHIRSAGGSGGGGRNTAGPGFGGGQGVCPGGSSGGFSTGTTVALTAGLSSRIATDLYGRSGSGGGAVAATGAMGGDATPYCAGGGGAGGANGVTGLAGGRGGRGFVRVYWR